MRAATDRGAVPHVVGPVRSKAAALDAIGAAFAFPAYYGRNLDALHDMLTDLSWLPDGEHVLVWAGSAELLAADPAAHRAVRSVLEDAARSPHGRPLSVVLLD